MASHGVPRIGSRATKTEEVRQKEREKIKKYRELVDVVQQKIADRQYTREALDLTSKLLKLNPEYYTIWNHRRRVLLHELFPEPKPTSPSVADPSLFQTSTSPSTSLSEGTAATTCLSLIRADLLFLVPLLREFPKCYWIWNHRLWLLQQATLRLPRTVARELWQEELGLVGKMLARDSRNFHGWSYRRTVVEQLESGALAPEARGEERVNDSMAEEEYAYTTRMIRTSLSNFSAWHNRSKLIPRLLDERRADERARRKFLDDEFELIIQALYTDPYDQSVWFYHEWLMTCYNTLTFRRQATATEESQHLKSQLETISDLLDGAEDCKWIYEALLRYTMILRQTESEERSVDQAKEWLEQLKKLDPLRRGRWDDIERTLTKDARSSCQRLHGLEGLET
ncbi:MAG: Rab geranylgeranyltransferase [Peltula sp. TS41687]|nr:MAG: Rab geranylgeranyltransferase [Peltula sp. TS41687]